MAKRADQLGLVVSKSPKRYAIGDRTIDVVTGLFDDDTTTRPLSFQYLYQGVSLHGQQ
jgi:hypothetical protein